MFDRCLSKLEHEILPLRSEFQPEWQHLLWNLLHFLNIIGNESDLGKYLEIFA